MSNPSWCKLVRQSKPTTNGSHQPATHPAQLVGSLESTSRLRLTPSGTERRVCVSDHNEQPKAALRLTVREYFRPVARRWLWALVPMVVLPTIVAMAKAGEPLQYEAEAEVLLMEHAAESLLVGQDKDSYRRERKLLLEAGLAESDEIRNGVRERLGVEDREVPDGSVEAVEDADVLIFTARAQTAQSAADTANAWATTYMEFRRDRIESSLVLAIEEVQATIDGLRGQRLETRDGIELLERQLDALNEPATRTAVLNQITVAESAIDEDVAAIDGLIAGYTELLADLESERDVLASAPSATAKMAQPPEAPLDAPLTVAITLAVVIGLFVGLGLAVIVDDLASKITATGDITDAKMEVLGVVPTGRADVDGDSLATSVATHPEGPLADAYHRLRTTVDFVHAHSSVKTVAVTGPRHHGGTTVSAVNLALAHAAAGRNVGLVDLNYDHAELHEIFKVDRVPGISDAVETGGSPQPRMAVHPPAMADRGVSLFPAGTNVDNPIALLESPDFSRVLSDLRSRFDVIVVDGPPVLEAAELTSLCRQVDAVLLVARSGRTKKADLIEADETIRRSGGQLLGVVLIESHKSRPDRRAVSRDRQRLDATVAASGEEKAVPVRSGSGS